ncbi:monocarboxylate transporter 12 [Fopius arisanus]|uniref:Monocarboxylate transporter 12 n=2 Tax=Fopius arisanus TaxID=64838 RepID=A0A9R1TRV3_9HYME|nr:PREDICTED: monocarboxylate transporter 12-like [Fopius arisanus]XP_011313918.1 PREDICTED: monocarboxylate transporter 12-like [Fopius arisanus]
MKKRKQNECEDKPEAPDGGWGWFACLGSSLITFSLRSLDPSFGLIFDDLLTDLKIDSTKASVILSVLDACCNFSGLFVGPLLTRYSFRTVAAFGCTLSCTGLMLTAFANSFLHIVITYSILTGVGTGLAVAAAFVALNSYFSKKRGQAVSFSSAGTALAMMVVPQAAHFLLELYAFRGTMLIIGAWSMHSIVGACLLRPLKPKKSLKQTPIIKVLDGDHTDLEKKTDEGEALLIKQSNQVDGSDERRDPTASNGQEQPKKTAKFLGKLGERNRYFKVITDLFDVDLLRNYSYLNVILGLSLFNVAESNFKMMTPFFLRKQVGMTEGEVAFCLSLTAFTDIVARLVLPVVYDRLGFKKRRLFWINALFVAMGRSILAEMSQGILLFVVLVINGFIRGAAIQNLQLSVSETCSLKSLPYAYGLFMVSKGTFSLCFSPLVGYVRDYSGSYRICLHAMSCLILVCFITWSIEFFLKAIRRKKPSKLLEETSSVQLKSNI